MSAPTITLTVIDDEGLEVAHALPAKFEVCGRCDGHGTHTNPAIDGNGITAEEMHDQGPEFLEDYLSGVYDVQCEECGGQRVVAVLDRGRCPKALLERYDEQQREEAEYQAMCRAERRAEGWS